MKYEFRGKLDCPDWILAQLFHASQLPPSKFEIICESVKRALLNESPFDESKLFADLGLQAAGDERAVCETRQASSFDIDDARACFGAIDYIITSACLHRVSAIQLAQELEQLGLASEHSRVVGRIMDADDYALLAERARQRLAQNHQAILES